MLVNPASREFDLELNLNIVYIIFGICAHGNEEPAHLNEFFSVVPVAYGAENDIVANLEAVQLRSARVNTGFAARGRSVALDLR